MKKLKSKVTWIIKNNEILECESLYLNKIEFTFPFEDQWLCFSNGIFYIESGRDVFLTLKDATNKLELVKENRLQFCLEEMRRYQKEIESL